MKREIIVLIFKEEGRYIARAQEFIITEVGSTEEEALENLKNTIQTLSKEYTLKRYPLSIKNQDPKVRKVIIAVDI